MADKKVSLMDPDLAPSLDDVLMTLDGGATNKQVTISDLLELLSANISQGDGWDSVGVGVSSVTYNGNRSYTVDFSSSVASILAPHIRLRFDRATNAPTQCTSLNGTTQYYTKSSPNKTTFTGNFTCMAYIKVSSYAAGGIIERDSAGASASGWGVVMNSSGQISVFWRNASGASSVSTYQSVPLNKWIHIAVSVTASTPTASIYFDGIAVPSQVTLSGANTVVQPTTQLNIGNRNSISSPFPGKIAQAAYYSAALTQSTIRSTISQGHTGSETNLISAYSFDGSITDLNTTTPNDLTAQGSATATNADTPYSLDANETAGSYDYGLVMDVLGSAAEIQVPWGCNIPTTGSFTAIEYSIAGAPFGFPLNKDRWKIESYFRAQTSTTSNASYGNFSSGGWALTLPVGQWSELGYNLPIFSADTTSTYWNISPTSIVGAALASEDIRYTSRIQSGGATNNFIKAVINNSITTSAVQTWVLYTLGATTAHGVDADNQPASIFAIPAGI